MHFKPVRLLVALWLLLPAFLLAQNIDRKALVQRHNITLHAFDTLSSLTVGNGAFAFTVDATGLQTFPALYANGVPLGTQSEWGWHSYPNTENYRFEESLRAYDLQGRKITFGIQYKEGRNKAAGDFFRQNPHRLQLGHVGLKITLKNGSVATASDIQNITQTLDLYTGLIHSSFSVEGEAVKVTTSGDSELDAIGISIDSKLIGEGRIGISIIFPNPTGQWADNGVNYRNPDKHISAIVTKNNKGALLKHSLDSDAYFLQASWSTKAIIETSAAHTFLIKPTAGNNFKGVVHFSKNEIAGTDLSSKALEKSSVKGWNHFWKSGGAIDFAGSTDPRAKEVERRIILSQYLTKVQCSGNFPPQETGLTFNSWFGKPHLEMHWWHGVHYPLWGRAELLEKSLAWYFDVYDAAASLAKRQGYTGVRWQKMVDHAGNESPSSVGAFILWQQPHPITMAELVYKSQPSKAVLAKYQKLVFGTAEFMASYAFYDSAKKKYVLGPGLIPAQERFKAEETFNPTYELNYWYWALQTAQQWRERMGMPRNATWDKVLKDLSPLPMQDGVYLAAESAPDSYTNPVYLTDHPSVLGTVGMLPQTPMTDAAIMKKTFNLVWDTWTWNDTWGWDFPMTAMTAARLGMPERAIEALLMPIRTNTYLVNGHNYQDGRLPIYLPGNGGVLTAAAIMVAGYEGCKEEMPGIPKDGKWKVKYEGLMKMP